MNPTQLTLALLLSAASLPGIAQTTHHSPPPADQSAEVASGALPMAEAVVRRVDTAANKITLRHGEIRNLDMPPMSMVFQVSDPALLGKVKEGDKVRFTAAQVNGAYTVLSIEPVP